MQQEDYRATLLIILGLAAASLTGLARQAALAYELGAGRAADIYLVAFALPEFAFVALPIVLAPAFLPLFARRRVEQGEASAWRFGMRTAWLLFVVLIGLSLLAGLTAPLYLGALAPGFSVPERRQVLRMMRPMLAAVVVQGLVVLVGSVLQVHRRFARPALATAVYNIAFCAALLLLPLGSATTRAAWGVLGGTGAALLFQIALLWKQRPLSLAPADCSTQQDETTQDLGKLARLTSSLAAGYAVHHVILLIDRAMATTLGAGRAASLHYAYHLALIVGQASGLAVSTALFPRLAEQTAIGDTTGVRAGLADALRLVLLIGLPATCALVLLRVPAITFLLKRGAFGATAADTVGQPLIWYALAVLADALCQPLWRVVYARQRSWTVLAINGTQTTVRLLCNLALTPTWGYSGLALSAAIGLTLQAGILGWWATRQVGTFLTRAWWRDVGRIALATTVTAGVIGFAIYQLESTTPILVLSAAGVSGGLVYLIALHVLGLRILWHVPAMPTRTL